MKINEYQERALRTANNLEIENGVLGLCGESGECADLVKKWRYQGHELDRDHLARELGDVAWYLAFSASCIGYDLESIFQMNIDKLSARYPDGFDAELSKHRKDGDI